MNAYGIVIITEHTFVLLTFTKLYIYVYTTPEANLAIA